MGSSQTKQEFLSCIGSVEATVKTVLTGESGLSVGKNCPTK